MFLSFVDGLLLKPLAYPEPERIVQIWEKPPRGLRNGVSALNFLDWRDQATSFSAMAARTGDAFTLTTPACPIGPQVSEQMEEFVSDLPGVTEVIPTMVFTPPWSPEKMSEDAKFALGY